MKKAKPAKKVMRDFERMDKVEDKKLLKKALAKRGRSPQGGRIRSY